MAADDEFPRGYPATISQNASGIIATVTLPAVAGVSHVLDGAQFIWKNYTPAAGAIGTIVSISTGFGTVWEGVLDVAAGIGTDEQQFTGPRVFPQNTAVTLTMSAAPAAGQWAQIDAQVHDI